MVAPLGIAYQIQLFSEFTAIHFYCISYRSGQNIIHELFQLYATKMAVALRTSPVLDL